MIKQREKQYIYYEELEKDEVAIAKWLSEHKHFVFVNIEHCDLKESVTVFTEKEVHQYVKEMKNKARELNMPDWEKTDEDFFSRVKELQVIS